MATRYPLIVEISRYRFQDGPGIRSVVFFKGCPLRCTHCHNPETQDHEVEIAFSNKDCVECGKCQRVCPEGAVSYELKVRIDREKCTRCGKCADACPSKGIRRIGTYYSVERLVAILNRDRSFYRHSNGGVTLSGGECTMFPEYVHRLVVLLRQTGTHIAIQTSGYFDYQHIREKILQYVDLIYFDVKLASPEDHERHTGKTNQVILANLKRIVDDGEVEVHPRIPLVPGVTATKRNLSALIGILKKLGAGSVTLIPYNPLGASFAENIGKQVPALPLTFMDPKEETYLYDYAKMVAEQKI